MIRGTTRGGIFVALLSLFGALAGLLLIARPPAPIALPRAGQPAAQSAEPSMLTDAQGHFRFEGLRHSSHVLRLDTETLPPDIQPDGPAVLTLSPGATQDLEVAPGLLLRATYQDDGATLTGALFFDHDGDRRQGPREPGLPAVRIVDPDIYQYFAPFNDNNLYKSFADVLVQDGSCLQADVVAPSPNIFSTISLTASANNTIIYYDHWEDGYDPDPLAPSATTERITLNAARVQTWQNNVAIPLAPTTPLPYDGRDRITVVGAPASIVRAAWLSPDPGTLLAGAWEMPKVSDWSRSYVIPIGEDLGRQPAGAPNGDYDYVSASIMAAYNGTFVQVDANADGIFERSATINTGEVLPVFGSVDPQVVSIHSGARIEASLPVQVQVRAGNCRANYSGRSYTLVPAERWTNDYWSPVAGFLDGVDGCDVRYANSTPQVPVPADVDIYIFNPNSTLLNVNYSGANGVGVITIPPNETRSYLRLIAPPPTPLQRSNTMGVHLFANAPFWAVTASDTTSLGANGADFDWSYTLLPANELSSRVVLSWAPGNSGNPPSTVNGSVAFVQAVSPDPAGTFVTVDLNGDGAPDRFDMNGDGDANDVNAYGYNETTSDQGVQLLQGEMLRVGDPTDHDLTGASISAQDNDHHLAVVYGEDACRATRIAPFLDLGYTVLPLPVPVFSKTAQLLRDADGSGDPSPGDTLQYTLVATNNGTGPIQQPTILDTLPYTYTSFVVGSLATNHTLLAPIVYYDAAGSYTPTGPPGTPDPNIHAFEALYVDLPQGDSIEVTYLVVIKPMLPPDVVSLANCATLTSNNLPPLHACVTTPVNHLDLQVCKTDNLLDVQPLDQITYTLTYTNTGPGVAYNVMMTDTLPVTAINVSAPASPGVITPTILLDRVVFELGILQPKQTGQANLTLTLGPGTTGQITNTVAISTRSAETNYTNNTCTDIDRVPVTAVVLSELRADRLNGGVLVAWRTLAELDHYGFQVYRATTPDRTTAVRVTPALIPATGHGGGAFYSFFDANAPEGPLYYWIEDIDLHGVSTFHGPVAPGLQFIRFTRYVPFVAR